MNKENITITGFGTPYGIRISTSEHPSYTFKYIPLKDTDEGRVNIDEVRLNIEEIDTEAGVIELLIRYMKHCSQECTHVPEKGELRFHYNE